LRVLEESVLLSAATIYMDYLRDAAILKVQKRITRAL
jgi:outer membrane protein